MRRPRCKRFAVVFFVVVPGLFLPLAALFLLPDCESLSSLQKMVAEDGRCSVSTGAGDYVIQADIAHIENDTLTLRRRAATGDDSWVIVGPVIAGPGPGTISAKSVSVRFITTTKDKVQLTFHDVTASPNQPYSAQTMSLELDRRRDLAYWLWYFRQEVRNSIK